ncbi:MAG: KH domain-containing protein [Nanoarchaeota archaeon]
MRKLIYQDVEIIKKNKIRLEKNLKIKIIEKDGDIFIDGEPEEEYFTEKVMDALTFGFSFSTAMLIKRVDFLLEIINIKEHTKKKNFEIIRARIIGTKGKTLQNLNNLTKCHFEIKGNEVGIIGSPEHIKNAQEAVIALIRGAKQANVYSLLERNQVKEVIDLGLKKPKK